MRLAARGARDLDHAAERITDPDERRALRRRAVLVHVHALVFAGLLTAAALVLRSLAHPTGPFR